MASLDLKLILVLILVGMDLGMMVGGIVLLKKIRAVGRSESLMKSAEILESLIAEGEKIADEWSSQLAEKRLLLKTLNEALDKRIASLKRLSKKAQSLHGPRRAEFQATGGGLLKGHAKEILRLNRQGFRADDIAERLALPKAEVRLVMDLEKRLSQVHSEKGAH
jgi:DNA-binding NarL/FixJ family response regulator